MQKRGRKKKENNEVVITETTQNEVEIVENESLEKNVDNETEVESILENQLVENDVESVLENEVDEIEIEPILETEVVKIESELVLEEPILEELVLEQPPVEVNNEVIENETIESEPVEEPVVEEKIIDVVNEINETIEINTPIKYVEMKIQLDKKPIKIKTCMANGISIPSKQLTSIVGGIKNPHPSTERTPVKRIHT